MELLLLLLLLLLAMGGLLIVYLLSSLLSVLWLAPFGTSRRLRRNGFDGPSPIFPFGNLIEMSKKQHDDSSASASSYSSTTFMNDIHSTVFPYFARWRKTFGKVFVYWLGTEPFLYIADPEFLKVVTSGAQSRKWGKPNLFKKDRKPMFGQGLLMTEGGDWAHHRHIISPAFSSTNLKAMINLMEKSTTKMLDNWSKIVASGHREIDVETEITVNAAEIIAQTSFGLGNENGVRVLKMLQHMQTTLFESNRLVGVPFSNLLYLKQTYKAWRLGKEIDVLLLTIIEARRREGLDRRGRQDLLSLLLVGEGEENARKLTTRELVDECKTFFFAGHETTALAVSWTLLLLALHPEWQTALREEIAEVSAGRPLDSDGLLKLKKMSWVLNEVLRLYSPAPNVQRQAREDIAIGESLVIPKGTNMWVDVVGLHHDASLWGDDVNEFKPERFSAAGGCKHRMGFLPFGFGGRICVGRNLTMMEYKIVLIWAVRKYLGLPLSSSRLGKEVWRGVIEKIQRRIEGWQAKLLSRGGRLVLVNAVLTNIPLYFLSVFKAPIWVSNRLEALRRDFFWAGTTGYRGWGRLVAWDNVCKSRLEGGLGILNLRDMNVALLCKWWWKFCTTPDLQWIKLIRGLYYGRRKPLREGSSFRPASQWWRDVLSIREVFKGGVSYRLGNGRSINFWSDRWCGENALQYLFPELYCSAVWKALCVSECFDRNHWRWRKILRGANTRNQRGRVLVRKLKALVGASSPGNLSDEAVWRWNDKGVFTVKSTYLLLNSGGVLDSTALPLWRLRMPSKVKIFIWLLLRNRLLTTDNLTKRGWTGSCLCVLCGSTEETADHLFSRCVFSRFVVGMGGGTSGFPGIGDCVREAWERWSRRDSTSNPAPALTYLSANWWVLWKLRNKAIFEQSSPDPLRAISTVSCELADWAAQRSVPS